MADKEFTIAMLENLLSPLYDDPGDLYVAADSYMNRYRTSGYDAEYERILRRLQSGTIRYVNLNPEDIHAINLMNNTDEVINTIPLDDYLVTTTVGTDTIINSTTNLVDELHERIIDLEEEITELRGRLSVCEAHYV